uniref:Uncharacterized protein n=1 Tax=Acrobeloides nanus TaxID=290746 RepID=A0A914EM30_9BILA
MNHVHTASGFVDHKNDEELSKNAEESYISRMQYGNDQSIRDRVQECFMENYRTSVSIRSLNFFLKVFSCILYGVQVYYDYSKMSKFKRYKDPDEQELVII